KFQQAGRPNIYLPTAALNKEALVQELIAKEQIKEGPIALLSCVEPCLSFRVRSDHQTKMVHLVMESAKCTHLYHYYQHPEIGLMHIRVQSWFPFSVDVCINGRQWLARQRDRAGIGYRQRDNCFLWIEDCAAAQKLLAEQLASNWPALLQSFLALAHPLHCEITAPMPGLSYYWSASQSQYATDVLFERATQLQQLYWSVFDLADRCKLDLKPWKRTLRNQGVNLAGALTKSLSVMPLGCWCSGFGRRSSWPENWECRAGA